MILGFLNASRNRENYDSLAIISNNLSAAWSKFAGIKDGSEYIGKSYDRELVIGKGVFCYSYCYTHTCEYSLPNLFLQVNTCSCKDWSTPCICILCIWQHCCRNMFQQVANLDNKGAIIDFFLSFLRISKHKTGSKRPIHANHAVGRNNISFLKI